MDKKTITLTPELMEEGSDIRKSRPVSAAFDAAFRAELSRLRTAAARLEAALRGDDSCDEA